MENLKENKEILNSKFGKCPTCKRPTQGYWLNRLPEKTKIEFNQWCEEELCGDRGMGLKFLWDYYTGVLGKGHERAEAMAEEALLQIEEVKAVEPQDEKKSINLLNGSEVNRIK